MKRLFLVDGMSNIFRSYYAIRNLSTKSGQATNSVYGFTVTLRKLIKEHNPDYLGVILDSKGPTFRHEQFEDYKKNRSEMPDDLVTQLPLIDKVCEAFRVPIIKMSRYEADDIMATLARQAAETELQTVIVTNDKDLSQLVKDPKITILRMDSRKGEMFLDEAGVKEKFGVRPDQIADWLGLMGDPVDGIKGAPGIGEKGAIQLLEQFDSIENALIGWEEVKKKTYRESLRDNQEQIRFSRQLATVDQNVPVTLDLELLKVEEPDSQMAYNLFSEFEFDALKREFAGGATNTTVQPALNSPPAHIEYNAISTTDELRELLDEIFNVDKFAFSLSEDSSGKLAGVAFSPKSGNATFFDLVKCRENSDDYKDAIVLLKDIFDNGFLDKSVFDLKRAVRLLAQEDIPCPTNVTDDVLLQEYLLDPTRNEYVLEGGGEHKDAQASSLHSADLTLRTALILSDKIAEDKIQYDYQLESLDFIYRNIELPLVPVLLEMENAGIRVDTNTLKDLSVVMTGEIETLTTRIYELAGREFNVASPKQLTEIFEELNFETSRKTAKGKISTAHAVLEELSEKYELPRRIIEYRELAKLKNTYVDTLPELISPVDRRIHTTFNQTIAATGRLSSVNPNLQNIPVRSKLGRQIRSAFVAEEGHVLLSVDYSQIELRLLAHITKDQVMVDAFNKGEDIHTRTAQTVFNAQTEEELKDFRRQAKIVNFGIAYVIGNSGLADRIGISRSEAKKVIENYYSTYTGVKKFMDEYPDRVRENNCIARSIYGRMRRLPDLTSRGVPRSAAEREAINMPMQGSASDIVKLAMLRVAEALKREKLKTRMLLQVHDELVFETPENELDKASAVIKDAMENAVKLDIPLPVETAHNKNWF